MKWSTAKKFDLIIGIVLCLMALTAISVRVWGIWHTPAEQNTASGETLLIKCGEGKVDKNKYAICYDIETGVEYIFTESGVYPLYSEDGNLKVRKPND